jgi:hypothetical protein
LTSDGDSSQSETKAVLELGDLIKLQTASPTYTLRRLADWEVQFKRNSVHRAHLLETAKMAVQAAHGDFDRASHAARQRACKGGVGAFDPAPTIQFENATDFRTFAIAAKNVADQLASTLSNFTASRGACVGLRRAAETLETVDGRVARGGAEAEMMEIWWMVERKCMYLDAVAMMDARIGEVGRVGEDSQRLRRHSQ